MYTDTKLLNAFCNHILIYSQRFASGDHNTGKNRFVLCFFFYQTGRRMIFFTFFCFSTKRSAVFSYRTDSPNEYYVLRRQLNNVFNKIRGIPRKPRGVGGRPTLREML